MPNEMIERVAKAIYMVSHSQYPDVLNVEYEELYERTKNIYRKDAKAAIEAMHEPTEEMVRVIDVTDDPGSIEIYKQMIEAALK